MAAQEGLDVRQRFESLGTAPEAFHRRAPSHPNLATLERQESHDTEWTGSKGRSGEACRVHQPETRPGNGSDPGARASDNFTSQPSEVRGELCVE